MNKKLLFSTIGIIVLVGVITFFVTLITQRVNSSKELGNKVSSDSNNDLKSQSEWKTYKNEDLKFSIKYPEEYTLDTTPRDNGFVVSFLGFNENAQDLSGKMIPGYYPVASIYFWKDINDPDLKGGNWENEMKYNSINDFLADSAHTNIIKKGEVVIAGKKAYVLSMPGEIGYEALMFEGNGGYFRINFSEINNRIDEKTKGEFLNSFKFE